MSPAYSDTVPEHLLIRAFGEDRAARQADDDDASRRMHEALARQYRERAAKLGHTPLRLR